MNFDFSEDQKLLQKTARDYLEEHSPLALGRRILESEGEAMSAELWKGAAEMGWLGAAIPEEHGGAGFGHLELVLLAEEIGRALAPIPFGSSVYLATEALLGAGTPEQRARHLPRLADGSCIGTAALAESQGAFQPDAVEARLTGDRVSGRKIAVPDGGVAHLAIVAAQADDGLALAIVDLTGSGVKRRSESSIDPSRPVATLEFENAPAERLGAAGQGAERLERLLDRAAVLTAFEQLGGAQAAFDLTHAQILSRYAFGRPIGSFQAVKHRMADLYAAIQLARSNCYYAAWALEHGAPELPLAAATARVSASDAFDRAAVEMIQLYGGVGYTWEYDCHLFYRRARHLSLVLGSPASWKEKLIRQLIATRAA